MTRFNDGEQVDQFKIERHLARGGMADVYLATDVVLERPVVLKMILPELAAESALLERFQREAQATARLSHPNIVQIYTVGTAPGNTPYMAMEYIGGGALSEHLQQLAQEGKWLSTAYALALARQVAQALAAAHAAGIVHRDLKPSNILLRQDGTPVVSDLGIASVQQAATRLTRTGGIIGTPHYMSPEQAQGTPADARSDIYALGVITYELLSADLPFQADSPIALLHQHLYKEPAPLQSIRPGLSQSTYVLVETCLQKDPVARFQRTADLIGALDLALQAEEAAAGVPLTVVDKPLRQTDTAQAVAEPTAKPRLRPTLFAAAIVPLLFLLLAYFGWRAIAQPPSGEPNPEPATRRPTPLMIVASDSTPTFTAASPTATSLPTSTSTPAPSPTSTPDASATATTPGAPEGRPLEELPGSGVVRMTTDNNSREFAPVLSPDQRRLLYMSDRAGTWQVYLLDLATGRDAAVLPDATDNYHGHFSPDGQRVVLASARSGNWEIYSLTPDGSDLQQLTFQEGSDEYPSFSPDGEWIVYMSKRGNDWGVYAMRADGSADQVVVDTGATETFPVFGPDGETIVYQSNSSGNHDIFAMSWPGGAARQLTTSSARDANPVVSPDGRWIAFESDRTGNYEIFVVAAEGGEVRNITNDPAEDQLPAFSPDGKWMLFQSDREGAPSIYRQQFEP